MVLELRTEGLALGCDGFTRYCDWLCLDRLGKKQPTRPEARADGELKWYHGLISRL